MAPSPTCGLPRTLQVCLSIAELRSCFCCSQKANQHPSKKHQWGGARGHENRHTRCFQKYSYHMVGTRASEVKCICRLNSRKAPSGRAKACSRKCITFVSASRSVTTREHYAMCVLLFCFCAGLPTRRLPNTTAMHRMRQHSSFVEAHVLVLLRPLTTKFVSSAVV